MGRHSLGYIVGVKTGIEYKLLFRNEHSCFLYLEDKVFVFAYLPPEQDNLKFKEFFSKLHEINNRYKHHGVILMGDLNSRIKSLQNEPSSSLHCRVSKDNNLNTRGRLLMKQLEPTNFRIINGCTRGDLNGELTYVCHNGGSVIDLCVINDKLIDTVENFRVLDMNFSKHFPISVKFQLKNRDKTPQNPPETIRRILWDPTKFLEFTHHLIRSN